MTIHGLSALEARERVGDLGQVVRIDRLISDDGPSRGARMLRLVSGGALEVETHPDRALDIGRVTYRGVAMAWVSPTGFAQPGLAEPAADGWVRTWGGGLLSTVGLDSFGMAGHDGEEEFGTHGRIGTQPATILQSVAGAYDLVVEGEVRRATAFGDTLRLVRRITVPIGGSTIVVEDTVHNDGPDSVGWMVLYHVNLGWSLLDADSEVSIGTDADGSFTMGEAVPDHVQRQRQFALESETETVTVQNHRLGMEFALRYSADSLPWLNTWRLNQRRRYVLALEPTNTSSLEGRVGARASGNLPFLASGSSASMRLELDFADVSSGAPFNPPHPL